MDPTTTSPAENSPFPTTRWTVVRLAGEQNGEQARSALESLCVQYWKPLHAFVKGLGLSQADADDTVQEFLSQFVASGGFAKAEEPKGRLRNYLLRAIRNQVTDQWRRDNAQKRPSKRNAIPLDGVTEEAMSTASEADNIGTEAFDRAWAREIMDRTLDRMRSDYAARGKASLFERLRIVIECQQIDSDTRIGLCDDLGLTSNALSVEIHRFRNRLATTIRETIADTLESEDEIEDELRYLASVLTR
ncbi:MAG: sigma-70 family RNA polymerase sigma factor [Verrucomicrobiae bacterium]|nr:sigma-70 family RNA polymerase sigma factor [Verrucomicrobiae bacterium]